MSSPMDRPQSCGSPRARSRRRDDSRQARCPAGRQVPRCASISCEPANVRRCSPSASSSRRMPSRMRASLSMQSTCEPVRASAVARAGRLRLDFASRLLAPAPPAGSRKSACPCPCRKRCGFRAAARARCGRRSRGQGRGLRASRAPSSSRVNSRNTVFSLSAAMPMPVSITCISASSPRRRTPTRMRPLRVYLMALETRFWIRRRSRLRSVVDARATTA